MDFGRIPLFQAMTKKMAWLAERQQVLAQNVANVDTPGFVPQDLKAPDFKTLVGGPARLALAGTQPMHLAAADGRVTPGKLQPVKGTERMPSGNAVSLESEMMKVSETASDYAMMTNLYRRQLGMVKTALGKAQG